MNLKNYKHLTQVFLLVKVILIMMDHKITKYSNQFTKLLQHFLVFQTQSQDRNLSDCQMKYLNLFLHQIKVFLQSWYRCVTLE